MGTVLFEEETAADFSRRPTAKEPFRDSADTRVGLVTRMFRVFNKNPAATQRIMLMTAMVFFVGTIFVFVWTATPASSLASRNSTAAKVSLPPNAQKFVNDRNKGL